MSKIEWVRYIVPRLCMQGGSTQGLGDAKVATSLKVPDNDTKAVLKTKIFITYNL